MGLPLPLLPDGGTDDAAAETGGNKLDCILGVDHSDVDVDVDVPLS